MTLDQRDPIGAEVLQVKHVLQVLCGICLSRGIGAGDLYGIH